MTKIMKKSMAVALVLTMVLAQNGGNRTTTVKAAAVSSLGILDGWQNSAPDYYSDVRYMPELDLYFIYLKDNTEENQKIILDGIPDEMKVVFITCDYSKNELKEAESDLSTYMSQYPGIQKFAVGVVELTSGRSEPRLGVGILQENYEETSRKLLDKYGDKVYPYITGQIEAMPILTETDPVEPNVSPTVTIKTARIAKKKITVKWKKIASVSKYKIRIIDKSGKTVLNKTTKKISSTYKIKGTVARSYTIQVKAYHKTAKKWGAWSKEVVKTK